jgi:arylsulfatase A-like enzyme
MNVLFISIDSLRRDHLGAYDSEPYFDVETDTLDAFADRAAVFDNHYVGSLPCMPARREWLTGFQEFLWRPWGPIEPFDETIPQLVRGSDTLTQLVTDHFHYFQHGSSGYYEDYHGFEFIRGHEDDAWKTAPKTPDEMLLRQLGYDLSGQGSHESGDSPSGDSLMQAGDPHDIRSYRPRADYARNVEGFSEETDFFAPKVFDAAADWLDRNQEWEKWFCYVDSFDVHEPFHCPEPYASMYWDGDPRNPDLPVWPFYGRTDEGQSEISDRKLEFVRSQFAGKVTMVDRWLNRVFDKLTEQDLWEETIVIVTSDHGFLLGEHGWMGKPTAPDYNELAKTPLLIWHPESNLMGERIRALSSAVDLYATIVEALEAPVPNNVHSESLLPLLEGETRSHRDWALYGWWGQGVNVTDGSYTYLHPGEDGGRVNCYSTQMMDTTGWMTPPTPKDDAESGRYLPYTDTPVWKYSSRAHPGHEDSLLFHTGDDPNQRHNLAETADAERERMQGLLVEALAEMGAPDQQFERLGLSAGK